MTILAPDVPEDELTPAIDTIASYITRYGGSIVAVNRESPWGRRRLAYPIRYQSRDVRDGFYVLWYFDAEPTAIAEIDREIRLNDSIIRHLTIALEKPFVPAPPASEEGEPTADAEGDPAAEGATTEAESAPVAESAPPATDNVADEAPATSEEPAADEPAAETAE
jgi:small subunit ribosomal protein S6